MFSIDIFNTFSTAIFVFVVICYIWALLHSAKKIGSLYVSSLLKGILLVVIADCFYILIADGAKPMLLVISGVAVVGFSIIPKPPEE
jgi:predicted membrane channel-forming protein YqfA (hemolysin III family)